MVPLKLKVVLTIVFLFLLISPALSFEVPYESLSRGASHPLITVFIDNKPTRLIFDTGTARVGLSTLNLSDIGISRLLCKRREIASGVTGSREVCIFLVSVRIGSLEKKNVEATYFPWISGVGIISPDFFEGYHYYIDTTRKVIVFIPWHQGTSYFTSLSSGRSSEGRVQIRGKWYKYIDGKLYPEK